jgi:hypothetical protein
VSQSPEDQCYCFWRYEIIVRYKLVGFPVKVLRFNLISESVWANSDITVLMLRGVGRIGVTAVRSSRDVVSGRVSVATF